MPQTRKKRETTPHPVDTFQVAVVEKTGSVWREASALASDFRCPYPTTATAGPVVEYMMSRILATMNSSLTSSRSLLNSGYRSRKSRSCSSKFSVSFDKLNPPNGKSTILTKESTPSLTFSRKGSFRRDPTVIPIGRSTKATLAPTALAASAARSISCPGGEPVISPANLSNNIIAKNDPPPPRPEDLPGFWSTVSLPSSSSNATTAGLNRRIVSRTKLALLGST